MTDQPEFVQQLREQLDNGRVSLDLRRATQRRVAGGVVVLALIAGLGAAALNLVSNDPPPSTVDVAGNDDLEDRDGPEQSLPELTTTTAPPTTTSTPPPPPPPSTSTSTTEAQPTEPIRPDLRSPLEVFFGSEVDPVKLSAMRFAEVIAWNDSARTCITSQRSEPELLYIIGLEGLRSDLVVPLPPVWLIDFLNMDLYVDEFGYGVGGSALENVEWERRRLADSETLAAQAEATARGNEFYDSLDEAARDEAVRIVAQCVNGASPGTSFPSDDIPPSIVAVEEIYEIKRAAMDQADADPAVVEAQASWRSCVQQAGYPYSSREQAVFGLRELAPSNPSNFDLGDDWETRLEDFQAAAENAAAVEAQLVAIDLECAASTRVDQITRDVRFAIEDAIIATERERLEGLLDQLGPH